MPDVTTEAFQSQDRAITVEVFGSATTAHPAILLLYGAGGLRVRHDWYRRLASLVAENGFVVFLVHYFDSTGISCAERNTAQECFLRWHKTIVDAISFVSEHPKVVRGQIGLLGLSLGATLALFVAGRDSKVRALATFFGEIPKGGWLFIKSLPPTFIVHGGADRAVPVIQAHNLTRWLKKRSTPVEMKIYPGQGHIFPTAAMDDAMMSAIAFFRKHLVTPNAVS